MSSYHKTNFGMFGGELLTDMDGYTHTTAEAWAGATVDWAGSKPEGDDLMEQCEEMATDAQERLDRAEAALAEWQTANA